MSAKDVETVLKRLLTKLHKDDGLAADVGIDLIAGLEFLTGCDSIRKTDVTSFFGKANGRCRALTLSLVVGDERLVAFVEVMELFELFR